MPRKLVTSPTEEPVTLEEAIAHLRETDTAQNSLISSSIRAARQWAEDYTGRALLEQTWDYFLDAFADDMPIPLPPIISVTSVKYVDADGATQTLAATEYTVDTAAEPGRVRLAYGKAWPTTRAQANAVTIRFKAGYANPGAVPGTIKSAILLGINELYARREHAIVGASIGVVPINAEYLLYPYRITQL
jgi:uncharacterized phiE125 gp8 family phage protein